jgi:hypothetical protein
MTFGRDGALYISNIGFGPPTGQILKVTFDNDEDHGRDHHDYRNHDNHDHDH